MTSTSKPIEIFKAIFSLFQEEISIDSFTLREELRRFNKEEVSGGAAYLATLTDGLPRAINLEHYAKTIREKATSRQLIRLEGECRRPCNHLQS
jgi:replicative DNA helicase